MEMLDRCNLRNIHKVKYHERDLPRTCDKGQRCIDLIAISNNIESTHIKSAGMLPFYVFPSDHRPLYIDIDIKSIFTKITPDQTKEPTKTFTTKNVKRCTKYLDELKRMFQDNKMFSKVNELKKVTAS